ADIALLQWLSDRFSPIPPKDRTVFSQSKPHHEPSHRIAEIHHAQFWKPNKPMRQLHSPQKPLIFGQKECFGSNFRFRAKPFHSRWKSLRCYKHSPRNEFS